MTDYYIPGQKAFDLLKRDVQMNTLRQGYIFSGSEGIGKKTAAREFAKMIFCTGDKKPCGMCHGCKMFDAKTHPDFFVMDELPVKIESVRRLNDELFIRPIISDRKVFIVEHAGEMNTESQNAFLKSFEEPPGYAVIILITDSMHKLLPTIISRGTKVEFSPFTFDEIEKFVMEKYSLNNKKASFVARYSAGVVGRCIALCEDNDILAKRDKLIKALAALSREKISILPIVEAMGAAGRDAPWDTGFYFDVFVSFFRDVLAVKSCCGVINTDYEELIKDFALSIKGSSARGVIDIASLVKKKLSSNIKAKMKYDLWITNMLINCWEEIYGTGNRS